MRVCCVGWVYIDFDSFFVRLAEPEEESAELQKAKRAHGMLVGDQKAVLARVMEGFATVLGVTDEFVSSEGWKNRGSWGKREWEIWETWGWYRHFCREVSLNLSLETDRVTE